MNIGAVLEEKMGLQDQFSQSLAIIKKNRDLKNNVRISEDLIWEDCEGNKQLRTVIKEAYEAGKRPRFHHAKL